MDNESLIPKTSVSNIFYALATLTLVIIALLYFDGIFKPFVVAFLIWFIINQVKLVIDKIKIKGKSLPSAISSTLAFLIIFILTFLVIEILVNNLEGIVASMPDVYCQSE